VDTAIEQGNLKYARENLPNLASAIQNDPVITQQEKDLERSWMEIRTAKIQGLDAEQKGDWPGVVRERVRQVRYLVGMKKYFRQILEPFELKQIEYEVKSVARKAQEAATEKSVPLPEDLAKILEDDKGTDRMMAEESEARQKELEKAMALKPKMQFTQIDPEGYFTYKPVYKRWWFWAAIVGVAGAAVGMTYLLSPRESPEPKVVLP
jgi:hypothetical protein